MQVIKVKRLELLEKLKSNRVNHIKIVEEALANFRTEVIKELEAAIEEAKTGKRIRHTISVDQPMNMTQEYNVAISALEMSVDDEISMSLNDFRCYAMDMWSWRGQFLAANSKYSAEATTMLAQTME